MENKKKEEEKNIPEVPAYQTFPLADSNAVDCASNISIPSEENVERAKKWVDFNQK